MNKAIGKYKSLPIQVRASFWFLVCSFLQKSIAMITTPIFTRIMTTSEYGQFGTFNSWYNIITIIVSLNLCYSVYTQGLIKFSDDRRKYTSSLQGLMTTLILFWIVVYLVFHDFWNSVFSLTLCQMLCLLLIAWTTGIFNFWANEQRVAYSYKALVMITLIVSIAKPVLEIAFVLHSDDKVTARIIGWVIVDLAAYSWMYVYQMRRGKKFFSKRYWKYALSYNLPLVPHYFSQTVLNSADRIMILRMVGESEAGIYSLAYALSLIMVLFNTALGQTITPWMFQKIKDKHAEEIAPISYATLILVAIVNLILILLAPEAVAIFAPESYYEAIWVIPPVAMSVYFMYAYDLFAKYAFYFEKTKIIMVASIFGAVLNVILNYIFIKIYGYIAAGYTTLACFIVFAIAHYVSMRKVCRDYCDGEYPYETTKILLITCPFMTAGFALLATYNFPILRYSIVAVVFAAVVILRKEITSYVRNLMGLKKEQGE